MLLPSTPRQRSLDKSRCTPVARSGSVASSTRTRKRAKLSSDLVSLVAPSLVQLWHFTVDEREEGPHLDQSFGRRGADPDRLDALFEALVEALEHLLALQRRLIPDVVVNYVHVAPSARHAVAAREPELRQEPHSAGDRGR